MNCKKLNYSNFDFGWVSLLLSLQIQYIEKALKTLQMISMHAQMENICACMLTDTILIFKEKVTNFEMKLYCFLSGSCRFESHFTSRQKVGPCVCAEVGAA